MAPETAETKETETNAPKEDDIESRNALSQTPQASPQASQGSASPTGEPKEDEELVRKEPEYSQDFRPTAYCPRCRRDFTLRSCILRPDTTLTEMQVICHRCKKKLKRFRLKEWYDHYVQNEAAPPPKVSDEPHEPHSH